MPSCGHRHLLQGLHHSSLCRRRSWPWFWPPASDMPFLQGKAHLPLKWKTPVPSLPCSFVQEQQILGSQLHIRNGLCRMCAPGKLGGSSDSQASITPCLQRQPWSRWQRPATKDDASSPCSDRSHENKAAASELSPESCPPSCKKALSGGPCVLQRGSLRKQPWSMLRTGGRAQRDLQKVCVCSLAPVQTGIPSPAQFTGW